MNVTEIKLVKQAIKPFAESGLISNETWRDLQAKMSETPNTPKRPDLLTRKDTAEILQINKRTLINWENAGTLRPIKLPGKRFVRYRAEDVEALLS